jgi:hypothetical protein
LRRPNLLALLALAVLATLTVVSQADALTGLKTYKLVTIDVVVTPSPIAYAPPKKSQYPSLAAPRVQIAASSTAAWDVAPGGGDAALPLMIAQISAQATPVPVQFVAKADPNAQYLHVIPHEPPGGFAGAYGTTVFPCAFEIYTYYTNSYRLQDWGYGTNKTAGAASGTFPIENYPTTSNLSWAVPDFGPTVTPYWNQGPAGETTWLGAVKQAQQHCIDLTLTVPNAQASGSFTAVVEYALYVTLP